MTLWKRWLFLLALGAWAVLAASPAAAQDYYQTGWPHKQYDYGPAQPCPPGKVIVVPPGQPGYMPGQPSYGVRRSHGAGDDARRARHGSRAGRGPARDGV
jgi:hypothetical protein